MNFKDYVQLAKIKNKLSSNNQLAKCIGVSNSSLTLFSEGKSTPSPDTVLKLGALAGIDEKEVLLDFMIERFGKYPEVKKVLFDVKNLTVENKKS